MTRIELVNLFLTKEALYRLSYMGLSSGCLAVSSAKTSLFMVERETRLELATFSLEG